MKTIKIAGVPEHFNFPWQLCIDSGEFAHAGIDLQWTDVPEGTGKLTQMLADGQTDMAIILTEGIIKNLIENNHSKILQVFVKSPLIWGIHVAGDSDLTQLDELQSKRVAISRFGSGSQLMAMVHAKNRGWDPHDLEYVVVNTLDGAIQALTNQQADYFMWERFMTQPIVDQGIFKRLGDCPTPWESFVIVVRNQVWDEHKHSIQTILEIINSTTQEFKQIPSIDRTLATRFGQKVEDIQEWLSLTQWSHKNFKVKDLDRIQSQLQEFEVIKKTVPSTTLLAE